MNKNKAFTLAETLIVLVILGIIASITIPAVVRRQIEAQNRTRIKKAMTVYDMLLSKIVVENNLKDNAALTNWGNNNNCVNSKPYFKSAEDTNNNCIFKSSDNIWWDISDITKPIIGLSEDDLNDPNSANRFQLLGHFDKNGSLRVDDLAYEKGQENNASNIIAMAKLFEFISTNKEGIGIIEYGDPTFSIEYGEVIDCDGEGDYSWHCYRNGKVISSTGESFDFSATCFGDSIEMAKSCINASTDKHEFIFNKLPTNNNGDYKSYDCFYFGEITNDIRCDITNTKRTLQNGLLQECNYGSCSYSGNGKVNMYISNMGEYEIDIKCNNDECIADTNINIGGIDYRYEAKVFAIDKDYEKNEEPDFHNYEASAKGITKDGKPVEIYMADDTIYAVFIDGVDYGSYCDIEHRTCHYYSADEDKMKEMEF